MKKIISLILCLVMVCLAMVSCSDEVIGDGYKDYTDEQTTNERLVINMLIITGDSTSKEAENTVRNKISTYTKSNYNTDLAIYFVKEADYEATLASALAGTNKDVPAPHIVLVNSEDMFDGLMNKDSVADLTSYYNSKTFGQMNVKIASSLLDASRVDGKLYSVPNNRVLGEYQYLVIDKAIATKQLKYGVETLKSYKSLDDAAELIADMTSQGYDAASSVKLVNGPYELRNEYPESDYICNVVSVPTVTRADAFESAFVVINNAHTKYNDRAVDMIYAINNDTTLRNLLQYGVAGTNYLTAKDGSVIRKTDVENRYEMDLKYTGNIFTALYCDELIWNASANSNGQIQNKESVFKGAN